MKKLQFVAFRKNDNDKYLENVVNIKFFRGEIVEVEISSGGDEEEQTEVFNVTRLNELEILLRIK